MRRAWLAGAMLVVAVLAGCGDDDDDDDDGGNGGNGGVPASHTVSQDGALHAPGLQSPETNCTACHGSDLRGGTGGEPSCFSCHGAIWN